MAPEIFASSRASHGYVAALVSKAYFCRSDMVYVMREEEEAFMPTGTIIQVPHHS